MGYKDLGGGGGGEIFVVKRWRGGGDIEHRVKGRMKRRGVNKQQAYERSYGKTKMGNGFVMIGF